MPIHVLTYEDMQNDTWGQTEEVIKFLNSTRRPGTKWHSCRDRYLKGNFQRGKMKLPFRLYTSDMVAAIEERIKSVAVLLSVSIQLGNISASGLLRSFENRNLPFDSLEFAFTHYTGDF